MKFSIAVMMGVCLCVTGFSGPNAACAASGDSAAIRVISSMATRPILTGLFARFEKETGQKISLESVGGVTAAKRVEAGEAFDLVILASNAIDTLIASGKIEQGGKVDLVKSGVAIAVRKGARTFAVNNEEAVKQAVLQAGTVSYSTGPSGVYLSRLFERWGIAGQIKDRIVRPAPGIPVGSLVAKGEVELGFQQLSELMHVDGIVVLGPLPADIQTTTVFSAGITTTTKQRGAVKQLLTFLTSPQTAKVKTDNGMDPV